MNRYCIVILATLAIAAVVFADEEKKNYGSKYDNVDVDKILGNDRILTQYIKCMMEEGSCTPEGRELKKTLPDALSSGCSKCSEKQRQTSEKVIQHLSQHRQADFKRLQEKYDPKGEFKKRYEQQFGKNAE